MDRWWIRPVVRLVLAVALPFLVPLLIAAMIWAMPGDPATNVCPDCSGEGMMKMIQDRNLDQGPLHFYTEWMSSMVSGDFGRSWSFQSGEEVSYLLKSGVGFTLKLFLLGAVFILAGAILTAKQWIPRWAKSAVRLVGMLPGLVLSLAAIAVYTVYINPSAMETTWTQVFMGALILAIADAALSGTIDGVDEVIETEGRRRYVQIAILRGESTLKNILPNTLPGLVGQIRARLLGLLSAAIIIEMILKINGVGELLVVGALKQDFPLVMACTFFYVVISSVMLFLQASIEIAVALSIRKSPAGVE